MQTALQSPPVEETTVDWFKAALELDVTVVITTDVDMDVDVDVAGIVVEKPSEQ